MKIICFVLVVAFCAFVKADDKSAPAAAAAGVVAAAGDAAKTADAAAKPAGALTGPQAAPPASIQAQPQASAGAPAQAGGVISGMLDIWIGVGDKMYETSRNMWSGLSSFARQPGFFRK